MHELARVVEILVQIPQNTRYSVSEYPREMKIVRDDGTSGFSWQNTPPPPPPPKMKIWANWPELRKVGTEYPPPPPPTKTTYQIWADCPKLGKVGTEYSRHLPRPQK